MARFAFGTMAFLAIFTLINGCVPTGTKNPRKRTRELHTENLDKGIGLDFVFRPRNAKTVTAQDYKQTEEEFLKMDSNNDGVVDACEWASFSDETRVREFVKLLEFADLDDNETVSLEELLSALKS
ncbi:hypothetical protein HOLleu_39981 [Holothuria leucospilota]|uniref:EF-hand domain-containing protein n=1 Tax=Holothuria leucospilota TaxID=206669 RepID=A0A9Q0YH48_HOLLE|nr:hypothetical protein HOLleu_39981 [Holothuria leucospilota]